MKITKTSGAIIIFISGCIISFFGVGMFDAGTELGAIGIIVMLIVFGLFLSGLYFAFAHYLSPKWTFWVTLSILFILNFKFIYANRDRNPMVEKYDVSTSDLEKLFITKDDPTLFNTLKSQFSYHLNDSLQAQIGFSKIKGWYNPKGEKINSVTDTIPVYTVDHIIYNRNKNIIIYFITYLDFLNVHKNDSLPGRLEFHIAGTAIVSVKIDKNGNWIQQNIPVNTIGGLKINELYQEQQIDLSSPIIKDLQSTIEKFLIVDFHYGSVSFWDDIMVKKS